MYKLLNQLQTDGQHILLLNRDDQADFRLDTTYTHKNFAALTKDNTITTRTDFISKHQPHLQTTSYKFSKTKTTGEVCIGIVKASGVHQKSPAQHSVDLPSLENTDYSFLFKDDRGNNKRIECVCVYGATVKGPGFNEVQFMWTERHVQRPAFVT